MSLERWIKFANILTVLGLSLILLTASGLEFALHELPCPLCLLQRAGLLCVILAFMMNLHFGVRTTYYGLALLGTLLTGIMALRQIALHVIPSTGSYGPPVFGLHLYTWLFMITLALIAWIAYLLLYHHQFFSEIAEKTRVQKKGMIILNGVVFFVIALNIVTTYLECGFKQCPENPVEYMIHFIG